MDALATMKAAETLGINDRRIENEHVSIYPNPSTNRINILFDENFDQEIEQIKVLNNLGQEVMQLENYDKEVDISQLPKGLYHIIIVSGTSYSSSKFLKN